MDLSINQNTLVKALTAVSRSVSSKVSLPILSHVLLAADNQQLSLSATNLETGISITIPATVKKPGSLTLPARILTEIVSSLPVQPIELTADGLILQLSCGKHKSTISGLDAKEFPDIPSISTQPTLTFEGRKLSDAIRDVVYAVASDESRPVLTGVCFEFGGDKGITIVATDGYRLAHQTISLEQKLTENLAVIIPGKALVELTRLVEEYKDNVMVKILLTKEQNQIIFQIENVTFVSRLIEGQFPNWKKVVPESFTTQVLLPVDGFTASIRLAAVFARDGANVVQLGFDPSGISVSSSAKQTGEQKSLVEAEVEGDRNEIAFNVRYLLDLLSHVKTKELRFEMSQPLSPGIFKIPHNPSFFHVIMPIRLQG